MKQFKSFKYTIYPTEDQQVLLSKTFGCKRYVYNHYLNVQQERYKTGQKHLSHYDMNYRVTKLKQEYPWLREADSQALYASVEDLSTAYKNFFNSISGKRKGPKIEPPTFKTKHSRQSYRTKGVRINDDGTIQIPKLKAVEAVVHNPIPDGAVIKSATVSKNKDGRYYVSILTELEVQLQPMSGREVGCDLGLKELLITSCGIKFARPTDLPNLAKTKRLIKAKQRQFSRTEEGSKNREKARVELARLNSRATRQRNEYYHLISKFLVDNHDAIYMEDLAVKNLLKNSKLSRAIHEASWSTLSRMIEYKAAWAGKTYHKIGRFVPSSKTCSSCEHKLEKLDLATRSWECPSCNELHDRDINAAKNIIRFGQVDCYGSLKSQATGDSGLNVPLALQKMTSKTGRSSSLLLVGHWSEQAA